MIGARLVNSLALLFTRPTFQVVGDTRCSVMSLLSVDFVSPSKYELLLSLVVGIYRGQ